LGYAPVRLWFVMPGLDQGIHPVRKNLCEG
jgi:hypothetical protein